MMLFLYNSKVILSFENKVYLIFHFHFELRNLKFHIISYYVKCYKFTFLCKFTYYNIKILLDWRYFMLLNCILLALSVSIDSLGIGISYGIKHTKISKISNFILFVISFIMTSLSIFIGNTISSILSENFSVFIGSFLLILLGIHGIYKNYLNKTTNYDFNNSNVIDKKEAIFLGLALSVDSFYVGLGSGIIGINDILLPFFVSIFQLFFINCSANIANLLLSKLKISDNILSYLSSFALIFLGILKILF